ncbi:MAG: hypothetical protein M5R36_24860 [Deltaproteobacteria bacterium]|nr:hypothetical protein [Deltaproteobacteria bacterium]
MSKDTLPSPHFSPAYAGARPTRPFSPGRPVTHLALFAATVVSVYLSSRPTNPLAWFTTSSVFESVAFSCAVMGILLAHELGHYIAGRLHGVQLTLP